MNAAPLKLSVPLIAHRSGVCVATVYNFMAGKRVTRKTEIKLARFKFKRRRKTKKRKAA